MDQLPSKVKIESVIHTHVDKVLSFLLSRNDGIFQRDLIVAEESEAGREGRVVLWTFKLEKASKIVEWLLRMTTIENDECGGCMIKLSSVKDERELPEDALDKLVNLRMQWRTSWKGDAVRGFMQDCVLILRKMKYGQSQFILNGTAFAFEALEEGTGPRLIRRLTTTIKSMPRSGLGIREKLNLPGPSNNQAVLDAIKGIERSIFKQFENSKRVDEERHNDTIEEITKEEGGQLVDPQEKAFMEETKKMLAVGEGWKCVSHEGVTPIRISKLKEEDDSIPWCKAEAVIHTSAKRLLAYLLNFDSIERMAEHKDKYGDLPRHMHVGGQGGISDARHLFYCVKVPNALRTRRFEVRAVWEKDKNNEGHGGAVYRFAWGPAGAINKDNDIDRIKAECGFEDGKSSLANCVLAKTRGIYELREVAENITELTLIKRDELGGNLHSTFKESYLIKAVQGIISALQNKYERNERVVDTEVREALADTMRKSGGASFKLTAEQEETFRKLNDLKEEGEGWNIIQSPTPDVKMWIKYNRQRKGERSIATGKALGIVDCTAEEVAAWFFDYCGHEKMRIRAEEGHGVHLEIRGKNDSRRTTKNERTFAMVKAFPYPLSTREFVFKYIWIAKKDSVGIGIWPTDDVVEYGRSVGKTIRGTAKGLFVARNIGCSRGVNQCEVTYYQYADAGGFIPSSVINLKIPQQLMQVKMAINHFRRSDEVDNAELEAYTDIIRNERQVYSSYEKEFVKRGREFYRMYSAESASESASYKTLKTPDPGIIVKAVHVNGSSLLTGVGVTVVDTDVATCLAYEFMKDSREALENRKQKRIVEAAVHKLNSHNHLYFSVRHTGMRGLFNREFRVKGVWQVFEDGTAFLAYEDTNDLDEEYPANRLSTVTASIRTACMFEPLPPVFGIPQTKVTFVARADMKGVIPTTFTHQFVGRYFNNLSKLRLKFERDQEIDGMSRAVICKKIKEPRVHRASNLSKRFAEMKGKSTIIQRKLGRCSAKIALTVRGSLEDTAAYLFDYDSRANRAFGDAKRAVIERKGDFELLTSRTIILDMGYGRLQQECGFYSAMKLRVINANSIEILTDPAKPKEKNTTTGNKTFTFRISELGKSVGFERTSIRLTRMSAMETRVDIRTELGFGLPIGSVIAKNQVKRELGGYKAMSRYFLNNLDAEEVNEKDEITLGELLFERMTDAAGVKDIIHDCAVLHSVQIKFPWFEAMLEEVLRNRLHIATSPIGTKAECLSVAEATKIGGSLAISLAVNINPAAGVDEWFLQHKALQELDQTHCWFRPMMNAIALKLVGDVGWGLKFRVLAGAVLCTLDLMTDIIITYTFWKDGKEMFFISSIAMICCSIFLMLLVVYGQNRKMGGKRLLLEMIPVVIGLKPAVDAFRVASGAKIEENQTFDPLAEMVRSAFVASRRRRQCLNKKIGGLKLCTFFLFFFSNAALLRHSFAE